MPGWRKDVDFVTRTFRGKQDLERRMPQVLRAWQASGDRFLIVRDQDAEDCVEIKQRLEAAATEALQRHTPLPCFVVRIPCRELEAWYWGDLMAVEKALKITGLSRLAGRAQFRNPDAVVNPAAALIQKTDGKYQKIAGSRVIGEYLTLNPNGSRSESFRQFLAAMKRLCS
jgi:hypothetical protein